jgi:hypothetical protein
MGDGTTAVVVAGRMSVPPTRLSNGSTPLTDSGHTRWSSGFSRQMPPEGGTPAQTIDFVSRRERLFNTRRTFAAITAYSYRTRHVYSLLMDGSVHAMADAIDSKVWWALRTRGGQKVIPSGF